MTKTGRVVLCIVAAALVGGCTEVREVFSRTKSPPDEFAVFDSSGAVVLGPIDMQGQTGSNGHLGIAVIEGGACPCACDFDPDPLCDIFDFLAFQNQFVRADPCACLMDPDPLCDIFDFLAFQNEFVRGGP